MKYLILLFLIVEGFAANKYIRAGASGSNNGSSWANAWTTFNAVSWTRGDTYYVAGGTYNESLTLNAPLSGTSMITIKKANASDNSGDAGWDSSYATAQTEISGAWIILYGYFKLDGVTGSGLSGYGIKIHNTNLSGNVTALNIGDAHMTEIAHCEIRGPGFGSADTGSVGIKSAFFANPRKGVYIHDNWIHDVTRDGLDMLGHVGTSYSDYGFIVEDNWITETGGNPDADIHGQGMFAGYSEPSAYCIIRRNIFRNIVGTAMIVWLGNSTVGTFSASAATDFITLAGHGLANDARVFFTTSGGVLPGNIVSGTRYYVRDRTTDTFKVAATVGGVAIDLSSDGSGTRICWYTLAEYSNIRVYNNIFYITDNTTYNTISPGPIYVSSLCDSMSNLLVANNSFYDIGQSTANNTINQLIVEAPTRSGNSMVNNLFEAGYFSANHSGWDTNSNNGYFGNTGAGASAAASGQVAGASTAYTSAATGNFTLLIGSYPIDQGLDLSAAFTDDFTEAVRGASWDIGAYEYGSVAPPSAGAASHFNKGKTLIKGKVVFN